MTVVLFWLARYHPDWRLTGVEMDPLTAGDARCVVEQGNSLLVTAKLEQTLR